MADPFLSAIYIFAGNFNIRGFAFCAGQILPISQNTALFSLVGTYYGGNGTSNFGLPDLRGRAAVQQGQGPGLTDYVLGEMLGTTSTTMLTSQMPMHTHRVNANAAGGTAPTPVGNYFSEAKTGSGPHAQAQNFYNAGPANTPLSPTSIGFAGGSQPFNIQQPVLAMTPLIALAGIFPARN